MNTKNLFLFLNFVLGFSLCLSKQNLDTFAHTLFAQLEASHSSKLEKTLDKAFEQIIIKCAKREFKEVELLHILMDKCDRRIIYYDDLIKKKEKNYAFAVYVLCKSLICMGFIYWFYKICKWTDQEIELENQNRELNTKKMELTKSNLRDLGVNYISVYDGNVFATYYKKSNTQKMKIEEMVKDLAKSSTFVNVPVRQKSTASLPIILASIATIPIGMSIYSVKVLCDQMYAQFYYEKYCFIKRVLEKYKAFLKDSLYIEV